MAALPLVGLTPLAATWGCGCLAAQLLLFLLFRFVLPEGPWTKLPGFTAHQVVCLPLMTYLAAVGMQAWIWPTPEVLQYGKTAHSRILEEHPIGILLSQIVFGELLLWDIPCGLAVSSLREPLMLAHHLGMAAVASMSLRPLYSYYAVFFLGAIEVSSIPLSIVDVFHPKHKHWAAYEKTFPRLAYFNGAARICFAAAYLPLRALYFPWVVVSQAIPDLFEVLKSPLIERPNAPNGALFGIIGFAVAFSALQVYWGTLVFQQALRALGVASKKQKPT